MTRSPLAPALSAALLCGLSAPAVAQDQPPPPHEIAPADTIAAMVAAAYRTGDDATIKSVLGVAKATFPEQTAEIDRLAAGDAAVLARTRRDEQEKEQARIAAATFFEIWKGNLEAGASRSTGSSDVTGIYLSANLQRDGLRVRQKFNGRIDYQRTDGVTTTERALVAYQPNYKLSENSYLYGLVQYERDQSLGYANRETVGAGYGATVFRSPRGKIDVEAGPAIRQTDFLGQPNRTTLAARGSLSARYALTPTLNFSQDAAVFMETGDTTASSTSAIDTKLLGRLKAKLSYNVQYEQDTAGGRNSLDTISRATLVYSF